MLGNEELYKTLGEFKGRLDVLEKLVQILVTDQLLAVKIQARDAENVANKALEVVQAYIAEFGQGLEEMAGDAAPPGRISLRGGVVRNTNSDDEG